MANPALNEKRSSSPRRVGSPAGPRPTRRCSAQAGALPPAAAPGTVMTANGTFAKTFVLFLFVLAGGVFGWAQTDVAPPSEIEHPRLDRGSCLIGAFVLAMVCCFKPKASPFLGPLYAAARRRVPRVRSRRRSRSSGTASSSRRSSPRRRVLRHARALRVRRGEGHQEVPDGRDRRHVSASSCSTCSALAAVAVRRRPHVLERAERARDHHQRRDLRASPR